MSKFKERFRIRKTQKQKEDKEQKLKAEKALRIRERNLEQLRLGRERLVEKLQAQIKSNIRDNPNYQIMRDLLNSSDFISAVGEVYKLSHDGIFDLEELHFFDILRDYNTYLYGLDFEVSEERELSADEIDNLLLRLINDGVRALLEESKGKIKFSVFTTGHRIGLGLTSKKTYSPMEHHYSPDIFGGVGFEFGGGQRIYFDIYLSGQICIRTSVESNLFPDYKRKIGVFDREVQGRGGRIYFSNIEDFYSELIERLTNI